MLRNRAFALASVLALGFSAAACGDDDGGNGGGGGGGGTEPPPEVSDARTVNAYSYLAGLSIPSAEEECCVDLNGDDTVDNALGSLLPLVGQFAPDLNIEELLAGVFEDGDLTLLFEYEGAPQDIAKRGDLKLNIWLGGSESSWEDRAAGNGVFTADEQVATVNANITRNALTASVSRLPLAINLAGFGVDPSLGLPEVLELNIDAAQLNLQITEPSANKFANSSALADAKGKPVNYLTGGVSIQLVADVVNGLVGSCHSSFESNPLITVTETEGQAAASVACATIPSDINSGGLCDSLGMICGAVPGVVSGLLDVDTNGNDVADALSLGVRLKLVGAEIAAQ